MQSQQNLQEIKIYSYDFCDHEHGNHGTGYSFKSRESCVTMAETLWDGKTDCIGSSTSRSKLCAIITPKKGVEIDYLCGDGAEWADISKGDIYHRGVSAGAVMSGRYDNLVKIKRINNV